MLSIIGRSEKDYVCLSTDEKPVGATNGSFCIEMDTKKIYVYDKDNEQWREISD
jgi:hypothetical protein